MKVGKAEKNQRKQQEEIILNEEQAVDLLSRDLSDDDEDGETGELVHTEAADDALAEMIRQRRLTRKQGLRSAIRQDLVNRTRAVDILEVRSMCLILILDVVVGVI